jgi:glycosyltransferase involved in cell wall biosynthesis
VQNRAIIGKLDQEVKRLKQTYVRQLTNVVMVSPSTWLKEDAIASGFFTEEIQFKTIPNGVDLNIFKPRPFAETRFEYNIERDEFVLLFTADHLSIPRKGALYLIDALEKITIPITLMTIGNGILKIDNPLVTIRSMGYINSGREMSNYYSMAHFFVLPSTEDNLPNTMLESFACGTPVVSFSIGGMTQYIKEGFNGIFAKEMSGTHLLEAIQLAYNKRDSYVSEDIRAFAEEKFNFHRLASNYMQVYKSMFEI